MSAIPQDERQLIKMASGELAISRVRRSKAEAQETYDRISSLLALLLPVL
ncbi:MAG: hypothetical protein IBX41_03205 [Methanophagales archaeon]|nr:hypothetical protein [Methanophagales archaeon]